MKFVDNTHYERFYDLLSRDKTFDSDYERQAMFFIFAGVPDLYRSVDSLYDFDSRLILLENFDSLKVSSGQRALVRLAYNLYNGYKDDRTDVCSIFYNLDSSNISLALSSIQIRYNPFV